MRVPTLLSLALAAAQAVACAATATASRDDAGHDASPARDATDVARASDPRCRQDRDCVDPRLRCNAATGACAPCAAGTCDGRCAGAPPRSHLGREFWATVTLNSHLEGSFEFGLRVHNPNATPVSVEVAGTSFGPRSLVIAAGGAETVRLPWVDDLVQLDRSWAGCADPTGMSCRPAPLGARPPLPTARSALVRGAGFHVRASAPVAVWQWNPLEARRDGHYVFSTDASLLFPVDALGGAYVVLTVPTLASSGVTNAGFVTIVGASSRPARVSLRLSAAVVAGSGVALAPPGEWGDVTLGPGDVLQLVAGADGDLSGSLVVADAPVAVFAGHDCANVPADRSACDHLEEQVPPVETLGREFVLPIPRESGSAFVRVRIIALRDGTTLRFDPELPRAPRGLGRLEVVEVELTRSTALHATGPVMVAEFKVGQGEALIGDRGDPAMAIVPPREQWRAEYGVVVPETFVADLVHVVGESGRAWLLDGAPAVGTADLVGATDATLALRVSPGGHRITSADGRPFGAIAYGAGLTISYMASAGSNLACLPP